MKRFLLCAAALLILLAGGYYLFYFEGFYLEVSTDELTHVPFRTDGKRIQALGSDGRYAELQIRGVEVSASLPGSYFSDFAPAQEDYMRWFAAIDAMGANTVRAFSIMDGDFYDALYAYNRQAEEPLYLLQGIQVSDQANYGAGDGRSDDFMGSLVRDGLTAVDVIHGRRVSSKDGLIGGNSYFSDVSPWVIGYLVGSEWNPDVIAYTNASTVYSREYQGKFLATTDQATAFEAMLAEVMDRIVQYEASKYREQRLIGLVSAPDVDFLIYAEDSARLYDKYVCLNAEHVQPTERYQAGCYAAYRLFDFCRDFAEHIDPQQRQELAPLLARLEAKWANGQGQSIYAGYLDLLGEYHTMPVVAAGYGFSSARGAIRSEEPPITEQQQGESLVRVWQDSVQAGWAGVFLSTWQDCWERRSWNTAFATQLTNNLFWHDVQCDGQNYGLMAFMPLDAGGQAVCLLDGDAEEWAQDEPVLEAQGLSLYARYDREYLYLMISGQGDLSGQALYLPLDMISGQGGAQCKWPALQFEREADFVLCLDGAQNSRLLVHERYDATYENFAYDLERIDPFIRIPDEHSAAFEVYSMAVTVQVPAQDIAGHAQEELRNLQLFAAYPTGQLTCANGNPEDEDYCSLADFCYGEGCVEVRIPWLLLNVADPTDMQIHQDYYENYGVEFSQVRSCHIGLGDGSDLIDMTEMPLEPLPEKIRWQERLKQSYYVVQNAWK